MTELLRFTGDKLSHNEHPNPRKNHVFGKIERQTFCFTQEFAGKSRVAHPSDKNLQKSKKSDDFRDGYHFIPFHPSMPILFLI